MKRSIPDGALRLGDFLGRRLTGVTGFDVGNFETVFLPWCLTIHKQVNELLF